MSLSRQDKLLACIQPATQIGLEIGPLMTPIVTRNMGTIRYIDHESTEGLKAKYASDPKVDVEKIVDVDYVWGVQTLSELVAAEAPFDYVIASHVIEHVPDFVGWLQEVRAVLKPGGILSLAIPDQRFCFDYYRSLSRPAEVIEAYLQQRRKPSLRQVFDHFSSAVSWQNACAWGEVVNEQELRPIHSDAQAWQMAQQVQATDAYCDVHCWVFTPQGFFQILQTLIGLELCDFRVAQFYPRYGCEFYVSLEAVDATKPGIRSIQLESIPDLERSPHLDPSLAQERVTAQQAELSHLREELQQVRDQKQQLQSRLKLQRQKNQQLRSHLHQRQETLTEYQGKLDAMESSKFWKLKQTWTTVKQRLGLSRRH
jgi:predicted SAM-dependent methyltransferase